MAELLLFQLVAPLGAFGGIAVGERRETAARPSHSALVGCLGAGLGLERTDPRQTNFAANLAFAVRRDHLGPLLADYHTAQTPPAKKGKTWATRREELAGEVNTILSRRDYHSDCAFTIACLVMSETIASPSDLAIALQRPQFTLYLGRKSCPLGLPPDPLVVETSTLDEAFSDYDRFREIRRPAFGWAARYAVATRTTGTLHFDDGLLPLVIGVYSVLVWFVALAALVDRRRIRREWERVGRPRSWSSGRSRDGDPLADAWSLEDGELG